jgi:hypothetical protein
MVSQHLKETLDAYHAGEKLKDLRLRRKMGLVGVEPPHRTTQPYSRNWTLSRIARVGLDRFFGDEKVRHTFALP